LPQGISPCIQASDARSQHVEIFSIIPEEQVSLIFWVIRHLEAFYSAELPWLSGRSEKDNSNFAGRHSDDSGAK